MQNIACTTERGELLLVFGMGSFSLDEGVQILAELVEVLLPLCTSLVDPLFGQAQCLGLDPTGADAADFDRAWRIKRRIRHVTARTRPSPDAATSLATTAGRRPTRRRTSRRLHAYPSARKSASYRPSTRCGRRYQRSRPLSFGCCGGSTHPPALR